MLEKLDKFIKETKGGKYSLSAKKLLFNRDSKSGSSDYFCSELVAAAYIAMGLLPDSKGPN